MSPVPLFGAQIIRYNSLHPFAQRAFDGLKFAASRHEMEIFLVAGTRTFDEQAAIYAQGRTKPGPVVTHAAPGQSWHNYGMAFDAVICEVGLMTKPAVKLRWDLEMNPVGNLAPGFFLEWGGTWTNGDENHFQWNPGGLTLPVLQAAWPEGYVPGVSDILALKDIYTPPTIEAIGGTDWP